MNTTAPQTQSKRSGYSMDGDMKPIMEGKVPLPNFKELPLGEAVARVAASYGGSKRGTSKVPNGHPCEWTQFFLDYGQGGGLQGSGVVLLYGGGIGRAGTFAICEHTKTDDPGANHSRGWHPGHCTKCGLDLTIDSGD